MAWFWSFHSRKIFYRWFHINHVPSGSRVLVGIKSVIHERSETSIPKSKTKWKYNLNCIYIPEDDNISDVEEQTAVRGDGGGQKSNIYFPIFGNIWLPQLGKNFLLFFAQGSFENCPGQFFYLIWKTLIKRMIVNPQKRSVSRRRRTIFAIFLLSYACKRSQTAISGKS